MDHQEIANQNIVDRYLLNKLNDADRARFEDHFVDCPQCLDQLELSESFHRSLRNFVISQSPRNARVDSVPAALFRSRKQTTWIAASVLVLFGLLAVLAFIYTKRTGRELQQAKESATTWQKRYNDERQVAELLEQKQKELEKILEEQKTRDNNVPKNNPTDKTASRLSPGIDTRIITLSALRSTKGDKIVLTSKEELIVLSADVETELNFKTYRMTLTSSHHKPLRKDGLRPNANDSIVFSLPSSYFHTGDYLLTLAGIGANQKPTQIAAYRLSIVKN